MRLLICTQAIDHNDPALGFFHRWVEEFTKCCEQVEVLCLREGEHNLPKNVTVHTLGSGRIVRALQLLRYIVVFRKGYDAVFVHMNPEYLVVAGWLWRLRGKKIALWYTHKSVDLKLRIAEHFATFVFTASKGSFRLESKKVEVVGHGIDAEFFSPDVKVPRSEHWLSVGRLMKSKRHDLAMRVAADVKKELRIAGEGPERERLKALARELGTSVEFLGALTQEQLRDEYRSAALLIHRSETGSLDKVVLEALLCDLPVDSTNSECKEIAAKGREYVRTHHSLSSLIPRIVEKLTV